MNRLVDWLALTRRGRITAGLAELVLVLLAVGGIVAGRHQSRPTHP